MDRDRLVHGYLDGQLSRRVFLRGLLTAGVSLAAASAYADLLAGLPAEAAVPDLYVFASEYAFTPSPAKGLLGHQVEFGFSGGNTASHLAEDASAALAFTTSTYASPGSVRLVPVPGAGTYPYHCPDGAHPAMEGVLRVLPSVSASSGVVGDTFTTRWADPADAAFVYDVQIKRPGTTSWAAWRTGVAKATGRFTPTNAGTYRFRARSVRLGSGASGWSPAVAITVS